MHLSYVGITNALKIFPASLQEKIIGAGMEVQEKKEMHIPYNILPLDVAGASQSIMQLEEVKASVAALWNIMSCSAFFV